jgi:hypothetical protein
MPFESNHVLLNCPSCLRPFRQAIDEVNAEIRETNCLFCGGKVDYAIALAIKPKLVPTEPRPMPTEPRAPASEYPTESLYVRRA